MPTKLSVEQIQKIIGKKGYSLINNDESDLIYRNKGLYQIDVIDYNGYKYSLTYGNIRNLLSYTSRIVNILNPYSLENIILWLKSNNKPFELCENQIYKGERNKLKFHCLKCNEIFQIDWNHLRRNQNCPFCSGKQVGKYNNLQYLNPKLSKEWISSKNKLNPCDVTKFSTELVLWKCDKCNHTWQTKVSERSTGKGCPKCSDKQKESKIATQLKEYILKKYNAETEYKVIKNPINDYWLSYDIYIYDNIFIEIHGHQHYEYSTYFYKTREDFEYRQHLDQLKKEYAKKNGIYIEIDLRKIKTIEKAVEYVESILN